MKCRTDFINNLFAGFTVAIPEVTYLCFFPVLLYEKEYQKKNLEMVPSDNYTSLSVLDCMGSCLHNKYSEDQPGQRYYCDNEYMDQLVAWPRPEAWPCTISTPSSWVAQWESPVSMNNRKNTED